MGNGTFSVGTGKVNTFKAHVRMHKVLIQGPGVFKMGLVGGFAYPLVHREA